jgi:hypothetical protein
MFNTSLWNIDLFKEQGYVVSNLIFQNFDNRGISMQITPLWFCICNSNPMVGTIMFFSTSWEFDSQQF